MKKFSLFIPLLMLLCCTNANSKKETETQQNGASVIVKNGNSDVKDGQGVLISDKQESNITETDKDFLTGKISFSKDSRFVKLDSKHCDGRTVYVRTEVAEAFEKMREMAQKDGITLFVLSGGRTFQQQKNIWERKWEMYKNLKPKERALKILTFSSMPMSSRHHWGTDIDMNSLDNNYFSSGKGLKIYQWLTANAVKYGFCQVYTDKSDGRTGYEMEKWHWSYMPLSRQLLEQYNKTVKVGDFQGFSGCETAPDVKIMEHYVNGITDCK